MLLYVLLQDKKQTGAGNIIDWLGDNAKQVDAKTVETKLKTEFPVLFADEKVELAFQSGRDFKVFTDRRIFLMDVKGLVGMYGHLRVCEEYIYI